MIHLKIKSFNLKADKQLKKIKIKIKNNFSKMKILINKKLKKRIFKNL